MTKLISRDEVIKLLKMADAIEILEKAFADLSDGKAALPPRTAIQVPGYNGLALYMPGYIEGTGALGIKIVTVYKENSKKFNLPTIQGTIMLLDEKKGTPLAIMDAGYLTAIRTGGVSGLATSLLARKNAKVHSLFGTGGMARAHAWAIDSVREIEKLIIFSTDPPEAKNSFKDSLKEILKCEIVIADKAEDAAREADIITLITTARSPVMRGEWIKPGTHINGAGSHEPEAREIDTETVLRSKIVCDLVEACKPEAGDLIIPVNENKWSWDKVHASLGDIITKKKEGRSTDEEITLFKTVGIAIQDVSVALHVFNKAVEMKVGTDYAF